ncbi:MAG: pyruvate synthase subunit PorD [Candidatus Woesearchaeota archaeon]|nr:MAG: pyruvate synthase subunit PorD [Candidatus Woesearchaeota archaeon]
MLLKKDEISKGAKTEGGSSEEFNTGTWRALRPIIDKNMCINCMLCYLYCPDNSITIIKEGPDGNPVIKGIDLKHCKGCSICSQVCPVHCIKMIPEEEAKNE